MEIVIRKGGMEDIDRVLSFLREIREGMEHKDWFYLDTPEDVRKMMGDGTMQLWVAMDGDQLAGIFTILIPGLGEINYGHELGFTEEELYKAVNMDTAAVHPNYRGLGLQRKMIHTVETELAEAGERILLCTVHPENQFSLDNVLKQGYTIQKKLPMYGSIRYILRKDIF